MQMINRVDAITGETLLWCGGENFDIIQAQKKLNSSGMSILVIREDKWAVVGRLETPERKEGNDGR